MKLSQRSQSVSISEIRAMSIAINAKGGDVINLAQGICDTETPHVVLQGASDAMFAGVNTYTKHTGIDAIRQAVAMKEERDYGVIVDPDTEVVVTCGASGSFYATIMALLDPGDEVIVFEPFYGYHVTQLNACGVTAKYVRLSEPNWDFTDAQLEAVMTEKTRAILVNNPGNPSGKVFTRDEFLRLNTLATKHDLMIISDEIYEYFVYEGEHVTPIQIPELRPRTVVVGGFSKTFSITGWRVGFVIAPPAACTAIGHLSDMVYVCAPAPLQVGVAQGIMELTPAHYKELSSHHLELRNMICDALTKAKLYPTIPKGAYYLLCDVSRIEGATCRDKAMNLLEMTGIGGVPGSAFFHDNSGDHLIRLCYAKKKPIIEEVCRRLAKLNL